MGLQSWLSCAAHTLQHLHPSGTALTPGGQTSGSAGHSHTAGQLAAPWRDDEGGEAESKVTSSDKTPQDSLSHQTSTGLWSILSTLSWKKNTHNNCTATTYCILSYLLSAPVSTFLPTSKRVVEHWHHYFWILRYLSGSPGFFDLFWTLSQTKVLWYASALSQVTAGQSSLSV